MSKITPETILKGRDRRFDTPAAANNFIKAMSGLFRFLKDRRHVDVNPVIGVERLRSNNPDGVITPGRSKRSVNLRLAIQRERRRIWRSLCSC